MSWLHGTCDCCGGESGCLTCSCCTFPSPSVGTISVTNLTYDGVGCDDIDLTVASPGCSNNTSTQTNCSVERHLKTERFWINSGASIACNGCIAVVQYRIWERWSSLGGGGTLLGYVAILTTFAFFSWTVVDEDCIEYGTGIDPCNPPDASGSMSGSSGTCGGTLSFDYSLVW